MSKWLVVTSSNELYFHGAQVLYRSFLKHCDDRFEFLALLKGSKSLEEKAKTEGMPYLMNPKTPSTINICPRTWVGTQRESETSCYRLLTPELSKGRDRALFLDADSIIMKSLAPLFEHEKLFGRPFTEPVAGTRSLSMLPSQISGEGKKVPNIPVMISSMLLFNNAAWEEHGLSEKVWAEIGNPTRKFLVGDEALLNYVLIDIGWHEMSATTQSQVGHGKWNNESLTIHFLGTNPWDEIPKKLRPYPSFKMEARALWRSYLDPVRDSEILSRIPDQ